jgi:hypothetical protein
MTYTQTALDILRSKGGSLLKKIYTEFGLVKTELDALATADTTLSGRTLTNYCDLTASFVSGTSLASNGASLKGSGDVTYSCVFVAPAALHITGVVTYMTEAYLKETNDAKVELIDEAGTPVTKFTYTLPIGGRAVKNAVVHTTIASAAMTAGDALDLKITVTGNSSATGRVKVFLRYTLD